MEIEHLTVFRSALKALMCISVQAVMLVVQTALSSAAQTKMIWLRPLTT